MERPPAEPPSVGVGDRDYSLSSSLSAGALFLRLFTFQPLPLSPPRATPALA